MSVSKGGNLDKHEKDIDLLGKMAVNEETIACLYGFYAGKFPSHREFWESLRSDEAGHAFKLRELISNLGEGGLFVKPHTFNLVALIGLGDYLANELKKAGGHISLLEALSATYWVEQSLIESRVFEVFDTDCAALKHVLMDLEEETKVHRKKAKAALEEHRTHLKM
jgi:hypothetical protein